MRRGNVLRLPQPPQLGEKVTDGPVNAKLINSHLTIMTDVLNQALQGLQNRINTVQQVTAKQPPTVQSFSVTGKQGLFFLTWSRIKGVDGYVITQAADAGMVQLIGRYHIPDGESCTYSIPVGNVAVTNSFQVYAYQGPKVGDPSQIVTATSLTFTTPEAAPPQPPIAPRQPKIAPVRVGPNLP